MKDGIRMKWTRSLQNNKGITLIELLAAIVLIGILVTSFLVFFPQVSISNVKTQEKLTGVNLAKEWLVKAQNNEIPEITTILNEVSTSNEGADTFKINDEDFEIQFTFYKKGVLSNPSKYQLYKLQIDVYDKGGTQLKSNIFGYISKDL